MGIFGGLFGRKPYMGAQIREDANAPKLTDLLGQSTGETQQPWNTQPQALPQKPGLFGQGGKAWDVIGGTADALIQMRGGKPIYDDGSKRRLQEAILQAQIAQQTHQANRQFDVQNPMPAGPPAIASEVEWFNSLPPEQQQKVVSYLDYKNPVSVSGPAGTFNIPRTPPGEHQSSTPVGTVEDGFVFMGGDDADQSNWKPVGGAGPQTPRPFP